MCGIVGYMGDFQRDALERASQMIAHRGPDDSGIWLDLENEVGLAHRRLSIIDLSSLAHQPMFNAKGTIAIIFNGEIYNYRQLREQLAAKGYFFRSASDTEVLICLYEEYGVEMLSKINGIFAFAVWDAREKQLFIARDALGVKPLYYTQTQRGFIFSSEMKAILCFDGVSMEINPLAVQYTLVYLWTPAPDTILKNIQKLEPGCFLIVKDRKVTKKGRFYDLPYRGQTLRKSEKEITEMLDDALFNAVKRQLVSDVPVGAFLSGGTDSSSVVAMMRRANPCYRPMCYCIGFDEGLTKEEQSSSDIPYAKEVARLLDVDLKIISMKHDWLSENLYKMIYHLEEPQADPAPIYGMLISQRAREDGIKVLLSGAGGDDIFTGYRRHTAIAFEKYWSWLPDGIRHLLQRYSVSGSISSPNVRRIKRLFSYASLSSEERFYTYWRWADNNTVKPLYHKDFAPLLAAHDVAMPLKNSMSNIPMEKDHVNMALYLDAKHFLTDHNLNYTDKVSMAYGVEVRVPLIDIDLVELACRIPTPLKQKGTIGKYIFKKTMERYLPQKILYRSKTGFGASMRGFHNRALQTIVEDTLSESSINKRGFFDYNAVRDLLKKEKERVVDGSYTIFAMVCLEIWCRLFLDGKIPH